MPLTDNPRELPAAVLALASETPHPSVVNEMRLFGQFVGSWDLDVTWHEGELIGRTEKGEWHFCYALDGRAVLDVWTVPPRNARAKGADGYEWGATLRFYDPTLRAWRSTWIGPAHGAALTFLARAVGNEIVLEGKTEDGWPMRWIFSQITPRSFHWRQMRSLDSEKSWTLFQSMDVRRALAK
jgi:hypothetical protein